MKKTLLLTVALLLSCVATLRADDPTTDAPQTEDVTPSATTSQPTPESKSELMKFINGSYFIEQELFMIDEESKVRICVVIVTDMVTGEKSGAVRIQPQWSHRFGFIDPDEIGTCIETIGQMAALINTTKPITNTHFVYRTRDEIFFESVYVNAKHPWTFKVEINSVLGRDGVDIPIKSLPTFIGKLKAAKSLLDDQLAR